MKRGKMDMILLNPDVAYLILVGGVLLTLFALVTPGTGILEIGALFLLTLAGYSIYHLSSNIWALLLLVASLAPFVMAIQNVAHRKLYLSLSIVGVIIGSAYLFREESWSPSVNIWLVTIVSLLIGSLLWFATTKTLEAMDSIPTHDLGTLVGCVGEAKTDIHKEGSAQIKGELWTVRSKNPIAEGAQIRVAERKGFSLIVEEISNVER
jgi:membrane-bound serine protease (ClpP class)